MSEIGEFWRDMKPLQKERNQKKKESDYHSSKRLLKAQKIQHIEHDNGHFVVADKNGVFYDFWATTGLFINRKTKRRGRGIKDLLKLVK
ncbi:hypothetical protein ACIQZG_08555 [Lysinibacillus sp. NPDC096418]|uniref:hypothetical protein n=1 Tax=Lysinibacillus sp. NPDC096418 TaxID=3364138 RepID=UPI0038038A56